MGNKKTVSIIILNWNGRKFLGNLLDKAIESALNQNYPNIEIIFADNGSTDGSASYIRKRYSGKVKVLEFFNNYGYCLGNNLAAKHVSPSTKYILFMNPDVILSQNYVEELVKKMENDNKIGIIQGLEIPSDLNPRIGGFIDSLGRSVLLFKDIIPESLLKYHVTIPILWANGAAMMIKREVFEVSGGFSPELFMYSDEADLCIRVLCRGYRVLGTSKASYHHMISGIASHVSQLPWYLMFRNRWLVVIRYFSLNYLIKAIISLPLEFGLNIVRSLKRNERWRPRLMMRALWYLIRNLRRELKLRNLYKPYRSNYARFIINISPAPLRVSQWKVLTLINRILAHESYK